MSEHKSLALLSERKQQDAIQAEQKEKTGNLAITKGTIQRILTGS